MSRYFCFISDDLGIKRDDCGKAKIISMKTDARIFQ